MEPRINTVVKPLEERIFDMVSDMPFFTVKHLRPLFSDVSDKTLYRILNKLEDAGRITFLHWQSKQKVWSTAGVSKLPIMRTKEGNKADLNLWFKNVAKQYDHNGNWITLHKLNDLPIQLANLFLVAQLEKPELKKEWTAFMLRMHDYRDLLQVFIGYIDSVLKHSIMNGDLEHFAGVLTGDEAPSPKELTDFKVWLSRHYTNIKAGENNEANQD